MNLQTPSVAPKIFLPGWGLGRGPMDAALAGTDWQVLDLPGTTNPIPTNFTAARDTLLAMLPPLCHLGGWSLGGMLALACAAKAPERFISLTLVSTTPSFVQRTDWPHGLPPAELAAFAAGIAQGNPQSLSRFTILFCRGDVEARTVTRLLGQQATPPCQTALDGGLAWLAEADLRETIAEISVPATIIHGENDTLMPLPVAHWFLKYLPQATLHILPGKAHAPFAPDPAAFQAALPRP